MKRLALILALLASLFVMSCEDPNQDIIDDMEQDTGVIRIDIDYEAPPP